MVLFKACPRCKGDMHTNGDIYGDYKECLQCGLMLEIEKTGLLAEPAKILKAASSKRKKVA